MNRVEEFKELNKKLEKNLNFILACISKEGLGEKIKTENLFSNLGELEGLIFLEELDNKYGGK